MDVCMNESLCVGSNILGTESKFNFYCLLAELKKTLGYLDSTNELNGHLYYLHSIYYQG